MFTFDLEEFDMPLEYQYPIAFEEQIAVSRQGVSTLLQILDSHSIVSTFFCTAVFAGENPELIKDLVERGHELASHNYYHAKHSAKDFLDSRKKLEAISGQKVIGFRMPRMQPVDYQLLYDAGYIYDSSLHPTFIPGRYNNLNSSRTIHKRGNLWELPASVTPNFRIPLFWLSFHHFPTHVYHHLLKQTIRENNYAILYFHPWEFVALKARYGLSYLTTKNTGDQMIKRFNDLINWIENEGYQFKTLQSFLEEEILRFKQ